ncbi:uncharacterized protein BJ171DRAFT_128451 [Polychytrium aggregatum]|uniref:uncharacterized protein n=1 Tax=Polychytrium aggregatum TaxID=110093 RepID=UPI0022FF0B9D|nr:uncharacterized protein BJ171DRAFT_128451 [Polychytrium aggregatum]KAI9204076.1 hypothetical protein BJ171DRAFT_128451 [Polychytrium aggregatum]
MKAPTPFADAVKNNPNLSEDQLLNANNYLAQGAAPATAFTTPVEIPESADVVVIGAGIAGLLYAIETKSLKPDCSIVMLERAKSPIYRIGESTLSPFGRFTRSRVLPMEIMLRLFAVKEGLDFLCIGRDKMTHEEMDIGGLDVSYQLDRRVSELMLTMWAQHIGVKVYYGAQVDSRTCDFTNENYKMVAIKSHGETLTTFARAQSPMLQSPIPQSPIPQSPILSRGFPSLSRAFSFRGRSSAAMSPTPSSPTSPTSPSTFDFPTPVSMKRSSSFFSTLFRGIASRSSGAVTPAAEQPEPAPVNVKTGHSIKARIVADASGVTRALVSQKSKAVPFPNTFNCNAYWAYFKENTAHEPEQFAEWNYPATKHIMFDEGWSWFIRIICWEKTPLANMMDIIAWLIDFHVQKKDYDDLPSLRELATMFDATYDRIVSIGWAIREDAIPISYPASRIAHLGKTEAERMFWAIVEGQPLVSKLFKEHYTLLENVYDNTTFWVKKRLAYMHSGPVAGPGWLALGNASGFTNPLISPGINCIALPQANLGAFLTVRYLNGEDRMLDYHAFNRFVKDEQVPSLFKVNLFLYNTFRDHRLFALLWRAYICVGTGGDEPWVAEKYLFRDLKWFIGYGVGRCGEMIDRLTPYINLPVFQDVDDETYEKLSEICEDYIADALKRYPNNKFGSHIRWYDDKLQKVPGKTQRDKAANLWWAVRCANCRTYGIYQLKNCVECGHRHAWADNVTEASAAERFYTKMDINKIEHAGLAYVDPAISSAV